MNKALHCRASSMTMDKTYTRMQLIYSHPRPLPAAPPWQSTHSLRTLSLLLLLPPPTTTSCTSFLRLRRSWAAGKFDFDSLSMDEEGDIDDGFGRGGRRRRRSGGRVKQKRWYDGEEDEEVEGGVVEQVVDSLWILQVFRSYGLFLPFILMSLLIATGPKAFLMGSGIPFGLSLLVFAFKKLSAWVEGWSKPKRRRRSRRRTRFGGKKDAFMDEEDEQGEEGQQDKRNKRRSYQNWVLRNGRTAYSSVDDNGFGGWDELIRDEETESLHSPQTDNRLEMMAGMGKLSSSLKEKDLPPLLRLLMAAFPFLGSWTNLL